MGLLGNHVTFGPQKDGRMYLHNTEYQVVNFGQGIGKRSVCWYSFDDDTGIPVKEKQYCMNEGIVKMWKTIACSTNHYLGGTPKKRTAENALISPTTPIKNKRTHHPIFFKTITKSQAIDLYGSASMEAVVLRYEFQGPYDNAIIWGAEDDENAVFFVIENAFDQDVVETMFQQLPSMGGGGKLLNTRTKRYVNAAGRIGRAIVNKTHYLCCFK
jgi:hypothetical protein